MKEGKEILITFLQPRKSTLHYEFFQVRLKPVSNEIFQDLFQIEFFFYFAVPIWYNTEKYFEDF